MVTDKQIAQWRAACDKATPGPWRCECADICADNGRLVADFVPHGEDSDFIVIARDALPALLDEVERLCARLSLFDPPTCPRCGETQVWTVDARKFERCPKCKLAIEDIAEQVGALK
jgi:hypothetical protein